MKVFKKEKMMARLNAQGRANEIDADSREIMDNLDGREVKCNLWRETVYGEANSWYCTDADGIQYPVNIDDCEEVKEA